MKIILGILAWLGLLAIAIIILFVFCAVIISSISGGDDKDV